MCLIFFLIRQLQEYAGFDFFDLSHNRIKGTLLPDFQMVTFDAVNKNSTLSLAVNRLSGALPLPRYLTSSNVIKFYGITSIIQNIIVGNGFSFAVNGIFESGQNYEGSYQLNFAIDIQTFTFVKCYILYALCPKWLDLELHISEWNRSDSCNCFAIDGVDADNGTDPFHCRQR